MKIHEYQAKALLRRCGVTVPNGQIAFSVRATADVPKRLSGSAFVVKAPVHAGGRGKADGVRFVENCDEAAAAAKIDASRIAGARIAASVATVGMTMRRALAEQLSPANVLER